MKNIYSPPVDALLTHGERDLEDDWMDYRQLGITEEHIPELIKMATDEELLETKLGTAESWATIHACRALGQFKSADAVEPLISLIYRIHEYDDDWMGNDFLQVFPLIGKPALEPLKKYLANPHNNTYGRVGAAEYIEYIGLKNLELKDECTNIIAAQLDKCMLNDEYLNGMLVSLLMDVNATDKIDIIRNAYINERVDDSICGDLEDVEIAFGMRTERTTERKSLFSFLEDSDDEESDYDLDDSEFIPQSSPSAPIIKPEKIGRNEPCPCGSGKKYKKCCLE